MKLTSGFLQRYWRHFSVAALRVILVAGGSFIVATLPPRTIVMVTGPKGGPVARFERAWRSLSRFFRYIRISIVVSFGTVKPVDMSPIVSPRRSP
jgi:hypothetical protein